MFHFVEKTKIVFKVRDCGTSPKKSLLPHAITICVYTKSQYGQNILITDIKKHLQQ